MNRRFLQILSRLSKTCNPIIISIVAFMFYYAAAHSQTGGVLEIDDSYKDGKATGRVNGGQFTPEGWKTTSHLDYIQYDIATCPIGKIEFDVKGLYESNVVFPNIQYKNGTIPTGDEDMHYTLFNMWDRDDDGSWFGKTMPSGVKQWHNPYKVVMHLFGYVAGDKYKWQHGRFRANVAAFEGGYDDDPHAFEIEYGPVQWQKDKVFHMELEWGNGHIYYRVDGQLMADCDYSSFGEEYAPPDHSMRIGSAFGARGFHQQVPQQITFSNFKFYRYEDNTAPTIVRFSPQNSSTDNPLDSYISITLDEGIDPTSLSQAFSISPAVAGQVSTTGNTIYYKLDELLSPNTTYTVRLNTELTDKANNHLESPLEFTFTTGSTIPSVVKKYDVLEIPFYVSGVSGNRYRDVTLKGVFQGPTKRIEIDGFWDGGNVWKIRMAPTEVGRWTFSTSGSLGAFTKNGSFECVDSNNKGHVGINPDNPYTFAWSDGTPFLWKGETSWRLYTQLLPFEGRFKEYIDLRISQGYNVVQSIVVSYINGDAFWKNEGGPVFSLTQSGKDYDHLNPSYFQWMDKRIEYMTKRGVLPVIFFTWAQEFAKFSTEQFERYEKYLVARYAAYPVFWCISGEYSEVYTDFGLPSSVWDHHGRIIFNLDPYKHPITLHPGGSARSSAEFGDSNWFGFVMQQSPNYHQMILRDRRFNKPVVNGEYAYAGWTADSEQIRIGAWEIFTAGGFFTAGFFHTFAPDKGGWDTEANKQQQNELQWLLQFADETKWWEMEPADHLATNGYCIANPGKEYIAYSSTGGATTVDLSAVSGQIPVEWLNPRTGTYSQRSFITGGTSVSLTPPFEGDWVLHIGEGVPQDSIPPNPPTALTSPSQTTNSITLSWTASLTASDGDNASFYQVYRDNAKVGETRQTQYVDAGLAGDHTYTYTVYAVDDRGNKSTTGATNSFSTTRDNQPPNLSSLQKLSTRSIMLKFDEPVNKASAEDITNYSINPFVKVNLARLSEDGLSVTLSTDEHQLEVVYTISVSHISDMAAVPNRMVSPQQKSYKFDPSLSITNLVPSNYLVSKVSIGDRYYVDRDFTLYGIPETFKGWWWIKTANDDKTNTSYPAIEFDVNLPIQVAIGFEAGRDLPSWMRSGWTNTGQKIITTDDNSLVIYTKSFGAGHIQFGPNNGDNSSSMYVVLLKAEKVADTQPPEPPIGLIISSH